MGRKITCECGTFAAYRRHLRNKETPCQPCKTANTQYLKDRKKPVTPP